MSRVGVKRQISWLRFCDQELLRDDLTPERRALLAAKAEVYRKALTHRCHRCGRALTDPASQAAALRNGFLGPECVKEVAAS